GSLTPPCAHDAAVNAASPLDIGLPSCASDQRVARSAAGGAHRHCSSKRSEPMPNRSATPSARLVTESVRVERVFRASSRALVETTIVAVAGAAGGGGVGSGPPAAIPVAAPSTASTYASEPL